MPDVDDRANVRQPRKIRELHGDRAADRCRRPKRRSDLAVAARLGRDERRGGKRRLREKPATIDAVATGHDEGDWAFRTTKRSRPRRSTPTRCRLPDTACRG